MHFRIRKFYNLKCQKRDKMVKNPGEAIHPEGHGCDKHVDRTRNMPSRCIADSETLPFWFVSVFL